MTAINRSIFRAPAVDLAVKQALENVADNAITGTVNAISGQITGLYDPLSTLGTVPINTFRLSESVIPIALYGDSRAVCGSNGTANQYDMRSFVNAAPGAAYTYGGGWTYARGGELPTLYPAAKIVACGGVNGATASTCVARETAGASATRKSLDDMWSCGARVLLFRLGINDITGFTAPYNASTIAAVVTARQDLIQRAVNRGFLVIDEGEAGYDYPGGVTADIAVIRQYITEINTAAAAFASASGGSVVYLSQTSILCNSDGSWITGMCYDTSGVGQQVHLTEAGSYILAKAEASLFTQLFGICPPSYMRYGNGTSDTGNLLPNADLSASSGGLGTGWGHTVSGTGATKSAAIITRNGKRWQTSTFTFSGSSSSNIGYVDAPLPINSGGTITVTAGQVYGFECNFFIDDGAGGRPPTPLNGSNMFGRLLLVGASGYSLYYDAISMAANNPTPLTEWTGKLIWNPITMAEGYSAIAGTSLFRISFGHTAGSTFRIGVSSPRMVRIS